MKISVMNFWRKKGNLKNIFKINIITLIISIICLQLSNNWFCQHVNSARINLCLKSRESHILYIHTSQLK